MSGLRKKLKGKIHIVSRLMSKRIPKGVVAVVYTALVIGMSLINPAPAEAAISVRGTPTTASANSTTSISLTMPSGTIINDLMIAVIAISNGATITAPAGWTRISHGNGGTATCVFTNTSVQVWRKKAASGETGPYSFTWGGSTWAAGGIASYKGVDETTPIDTSPNNGACSTGTNSPLSANNTSMSSTATANALVVAAWSYRSQTGASNTISNSSSMTNRIQAISAFSCGFLCTEPFAASVNLSDVTQAATGVPTTKTATATQNGTWSGYMFALRPAPPPTLAQSSYRFMHNLDAADPQFITTDPDSANDFLKGIAVDSKNGYLYMGGNNRDWVMEKRRLDDGSAVTSFGTNGRVTSPINGSGSEAVASLVLHAVDNSFFVAGFRRSGPANLWRIEKRNASTGGLCSAAECGTLFKGGSSSVDGVVEHAISSGDDEVLAMTIDTQNNHLYVGGFDSGGAGNSPQWRTGKFNISNGSLITSFDTDGYVVSDQAGEDKVKALAVDPSGGYLYIGGYDAPTAGNQRWRIEKRRISDGALCTAANCGTQFGTNGVYTSDPNGTNHDQLLTLQVDAPGDAIFVGGYEYVNATLVNQWRIEKLTASTGVKVNAFDTDGIVNYDSGQTSGDDRLVDLGLDEYGGFLYTTGQVRNAAGNLEWRIEKRKRSDGSFESSFGTSGVYVHNPSANDDSPAWIVPDLARNILYTAGGDRSPAVNNQQWRIVKIDMDNGSVWMGAQDVVAVASLETTFRLRLLVDVTTSTMFDDTSLKLQYSIKNGTCDTAWVGEIYNDLSPSSGDVRYHNNSLVADPTNLVAVTGDPAHGAHTTVLETIKESNNFNASRADIPSGQDGIWDFVLKDSGAFGAYCFRVVNSDNSAINPPIVVPEVTFCRNDPRTENLLRHGTYFCEGVKKSFFWSLDIF